MATAALNATTTTTGDHPEKTPDTVPATTTEGVSSDKLPASSTDKKDGDSGGTKSNAKDTVTVTATATDTADNRNNNEEGESVTDTQRKIRRAERFGMPIQLSEEEKRNSRAERFGTSGTTPGSQGLDTTKKAEELKRKARAERFGITGSTPTEEEEKKKARLSRFGSSSSADPLEEEKKKARALRFSGTPVNGNEKIEPKATVAGKAGGEA
ncbi:hypothetical protein L1987_25361 [Smallanthus sonchifolius]|uniref:Uncharacterized protein n=1 Tax=Smallanthus sonchifolius TaxID=185202 RepID=A0ACB9IN69_9ASTR|nr:hypothetical protein L1987_25361 [Smallanthus sonchifolius]